MRALWGVIKACTIPAVVTAVAWWLLPDDWAKWITVVMVLWAAIVVLLILGKAIERVRSLGRGPFYIRALDDDWL